MSTQTVRHMAMEGFEDQFRCCICLDIYMDPVSLPCAHNFCQDCIEGFWDTKDKPDCPLCKTTFNTRPKLSVNHEFSNILDFIKRSKAGQEEDCKGRLMPHLTDPAPQRHQPTDAAPPAVMLCSEHNKPLTMFCRQDSRPVCAECTTRNHKHHQVVAMEKQSRRIKTKVREMSNNIAQMIQIRKAKIAEIKNSLDAVERCTEIQIIRSKQVCTRLKTVIDKHQTVLVRELEEGREETKRTAQQLLEELQGEINQLQTRSSELQHLKIIRSPLDILQNFQPLKELPPTREWSEVSVHSDSGLGMTVRGVRKLLDIIQGLTEPLSSEVRITFDSQTASDWLVLSPDEKQVTCQKKKLARPDSPLRFDSCVCILGKQSFTSGRCCWVVQVGNKTDWDVGVARRSISRKGSITVRPDNGYWAICRRNGGPLSACTRPTVTLHPQDFPKKVGVFLDYEEGTVSFFDPEAGTHIYTFSGCSFTEPLYPYFNPCVDISGGNAAPLIICPLETNIWDEKLIVLQSDV